MKERPYSRSEARLCRTVGGKATFEVDGSVAEGARLWIGKSRQPVTFDQGFFVRLRCDLSGLGDIRVGSKFDDPGPESLGDWICKDQQTLMNPAVYVGGLLIDEGYAERAGRGWIRILMERREPAPPVAAETQTLRARLLAKVGSLPEEELPALEGALEAIAAGRVVETWRLVRADASAHQASPSPGERRVLVDVTELVTGA